MRKIFIPAAVTAMLVLIFSCFARADDQAVPNDQATALAKQLSEAISHQDATAATNLLDTDALFDKLSAGVTAPADFEKTFKQGFHDEAHGIVDALIKGSPQGGYHFLRVRQINGETRVLFRIVPKGGGVNYHDWIIARDQQGQLKFQDIYIVATGELMSQTLHRIYVQAALAANPGLMDRLTGKDKELADNFSKFLEIGKASQSGQYKQVLYAYKALPTSMQEDKTCLLMRLLAAEKLRGALPSEYSDAMADYRRLFPNDPSVDLDCTDALIETKQYDEAFKSLDRVDAFTGGDPYLLVIRGNVYMIEGGNDNFLLAKQCFQKAIAQEPTLSNAYWAQVTLSLKTQQYDETAALLTEIQQKLRIKLNDLTKLPSYAGFVKSDAYKKWLAAQTPNTPASPAH